MWRRRTDEDFAAEIQAHLESEVDRLVEQGMTAEQARAAARRSFGNVTRARERFHEAQRLVWLEQAAQDLRYAWRGLWHSRAFAATSVLTLAVGMGFVTVVFAIVNAYVLRPFAVRDPHGLHAIHWRAQEAAGSTFRWTDYQDFRSRHDLFDGVVAEVTGRVASDGRQLYVGFVSGDYFETLGARVPRGRALTADDARPPDGQPVALLTDQTWARLFDRDPAIVGRQLDVNGLKLVIVGVMAPEFAGLDDLPRDIWAPLTAYRTVVGEDLLRASQPRHLNVTARLRTGVLPQQVEGALALAPFETRVAGRMDAVRVQLQPRSTPARLTLGGFAFLSPLFAAFALVLVAACANVSNVMLARANARHREIGVRLALGASRGRIVRQLMTEGLLIAMLGGLAGLALAAALLRVGVFAFVAMLPPAIAARLRLVPLDFDYRVFLFVLVVAGSTTVLFALLPALQSTRLTLTDALRGQPGRSLRSATLRALLVTSQIAVSLVLLIVAATLARNGTTIRQTDLGMDTAGVISVRPRRGSEELARRAAEALTADPRVAAVVVTRRNPLFGDPVKVPLRQPSGIVLASYNFVSPGYFELLRIPLLHGRGFTPEEAQQEAPVAIVSAAGARTLWPGEEPVGKTLRLTVEPPPGSRVAVADSVREVRRFEEAGGSTVVTVIGVAKDVVSGFVYQGTDTAHLYLPTHGRGPRAAAIMLRTRPGTSLTSLTSILERVTPDPLTFDVLAVDEMVALQMFPLRAASWLGTLLSAVALALSVSGLYGVLAYTFGQRAQEIGIRMALGASGAAVIRLVLLHAARLASWGTAIGLLIGFSGMKILSSAIRLANVTVVDPGAFAASAALIAGAVALAAYAPARRAARIDPSTMLRTDA